MATTCEDALAALQVEYGRVCAERDAALNSQDLRTLTFGEGRVVMGKTIYMGSPAVVIADATGQEGQMGERPSEEFVDMLNQHAAQHSLPPGTTVLRFVSIEAVDNFVTTLMEMLEMAMKVAQGGEREEAST